jgi:hypothetical protein
MEPAPDESADVAAHLYGKIDDLNDRPAESETQGVNLA